MIDKIVEKYIDEQKSAKPKLSPAEEHQLAIARKTLRMPSAMVGVMGGMTKEKAKEILRKHGLEA